MATNNAVFNIGIKTNADLKAVNELKRQLEEVRRLAMAGAGELEDTLTSANILEKAVYTAFDPKLNIVNVQKFNSIIKDSQFSIVDIYKNLSAVGPAGEKAFLAASRSLFTLNTATKQTNLFFDKLATTFANTIRWQATTAVINGITGSIGNAYNYVKRLDGALNDIRIVTGKSAEEMEKFATSANHAAQQLAVSTRDYTEGSLIYYQQGLDDQTVKTLADITAKTSNVTGQSMETVSEQLTAVWNGYQAANKAAAEGMQAYESYVDKMAAVGATTASSLKEITEAMSKVSSTANSLGVDFDQLNAQIATIVSATRQDPANVGTALKTIYARISDIEAGAEGAETSLGNYTQEMADVGFSVLNSAGQLRDLGEVIEEIGGKWSQLTREQQISLAQTMAGTRQYNNLIALFDNWASYQNTLNTSLNATGTLERQQGVYLESLSAKVAKLNAAIEGIYNTLADSKSFGTLIDGLTALVKVLNGVIGTFGDFRGNILAGFSLLSNVIARNLAPNLAVLWNNFKNTSDSIKQAKINAQQLALLFNDNQFQLRGDSIQELGVKESLVEMRELYNAVQDSNIKLNEEQQTYYNNILRNIDATGNLGIEIVDLARKWHEANEGFLSFNIGAEGLVNEDEINTAIADLQKFRLTLTDIRGTIDQYQASKDASFLTAFQVNYGFSDSQSEYLANLLDNTDNSGFLNRLDALLDRLNQNNADITEKDRILVNKQIESLEQEWKNKLDSLNQLAIIQSKLRTYDAEQSANKANQDEFKAIIDQQASIENVVKNLGLAATGMSSLVSISRSLTTVFDENASAAQKLASVITAMAMASRAIKPILDPQFKKGNDLKAEIEKQKNLIFDAQKKIAKQTKTIGDLTSAKKESEETLKTKSSAPLTAKTELDSIKQRKAELEQQKIGLEAARKATEEELINAQKKYRTASQPIATAQSAYSRQYAKAEQSGLAEDWAQAAEAEAKVIKAREQAEEARQEYADIIDDIKQFKLPFQNNEADVIDKDMAAIIKKEKDAVNNLATAEEELAEAKQKAEKAAKALEQAEEEARITGKALEQAQEEQTAATEALGTATKKLWLSIGLTAVVIAATAWWSIHTNALETAAETAEKTAKRTQDLVDDITKEAEQIKNLNSAYQELQNSYAQGEVSSEQLRKKVFDLCIQYGEESLAVKALTGDYAELEATLEKLQKGYFSDFDNSKIFTATSRNIAAQINQIERAENKKHPILSYFNANKTIRGGGSVNNEIYQQLADLTGNDRVIDLTNVQKIATNREQILNILTEHSELSNKTWYKKLDTFLTDNEEALTNIYNSSIKQIETVFATQIKDKDLKTINFDNLYNSVIQEAKKYFAGSDETLNKIFTNWLSKELSGDPKEIAAAFRASMIKAAPELKAILQDINDFAILEIYPKFNLDDENFGKDVENYLKKYQDYINWSVNKDNFSSAFSLASNIFNPGGLTESELNTLSNMGFDINNLLGLNASDQYAAIQKFYDEVLSQLIKEQEELPEKLKNKQPNVEAYENGKELIRKVLGFDSIDEVTDEVIADFGDTLRGRNAGDYIGNESSLGKIEYYDKIDDAIFPPSSDLSIEDLQQAIDDIQEYKKELQIYTDVINEAGDATAIFTLKSNQAQLKIKEASSNIDNLQDSYKILAGAINEYQENSTLTLDTLQSLLNVEPKNLVLLSKENGQLSLNAEAYQNKTEALLQQIAVNQQEYFLAQADLILKDTDTAVTWQQVYANEALNVTLGDETSSIEQVRNNTIRLLEAKAADIALTLQQKQAYQGLIDTAKITFDAIGSVDTSKLPTIMGGSSKSGGSKSNKDLKIYEEEFDIFMDINNAIKQLEAALNDLNTAQSHLSGDELIHALKEENKLLDQQKQKYEELFEAQKKQVGRYMDALQDYGAVFDNSGELQNYYDITTTELAKYNDAVTRYNKGLLDETAFEVIEKSYETFKSTLEDYESLYYDSLQDTRDKLEDIWYKQIENNLKAWETEIKIQLDLSEAKRDLSDFFKQIETNFKLRFRNISREMQNILEKALTYSAEDNTGTVWTDISAINDVKAEIEKFNRGQQSEMFVSSSEAEEKLKELQKTLMEDAGALYDLWEESWNAYLEYIDQAKDKFDDLNDKFDDLNEQLEYQVQLSKLLVLNYTTEDEKLIEKQNLYDKINDIYQTQTQNNKTQIDNLRNEVSMWREMANAADQTSEDYQKFYDNMIAAQNKLNDLVVQNIELLKEKYLNTVNHVLDQIENRVFNGMSFDKFKDRWSDLTKWSDMYYDNIERTYQTETLMAKWQDAVDKTSTLENQKKLNDLMAEELKDLREENLLSKYDIEYSERKLALYQAQMALEDAQNAKNSMKLVRSEDGNWSYQYVADEDDVADKEQKLKDAYYELYEFSKKSREEAFDTYLEMYQRYKELVLEISEDTTMSVQEKQDQINALYEEYWGEEGKLTILSAEFNQREVDFGWVTAESLWALFDEDLVRFEETTNAKQQFWDDLNNFMQVSWDDTSNFVQEQTNQMNIAFQEYAQAVGDCTQYIDSNLEQVIYTIDSVTGVTDALIQETVDGTAVMVGNVKRVEQAWLDVKTATLKALEALDAYSGTNFTGMAITAIGNITAEKVAAIEEAAASAGGGGIPSSTFKGNIEDTTTKQYKVVWWDHERSGEFTYNSYLEALRKMKSYNLQNLPGVGANITKLNTGGYTGEWFDNSDGKLAVLHQKELVLNADDTSNMLSAVSIVRDIAGIGDSINSAIANTISKMVNNLILNTNTVSKIQRDSGENSRQNIFNINADFPNANSAAEIRDAILSLPTYASQFIFRNTK